MSDSSCNFDTLDARDRALIVATQAGLPLTPRPYHTVAEQIGASPAWVMARLASMVDTGVIRRIAAVPNHYRLGFRGNGMSVWDVDDRRITQLGRAVGALPFVSHCYHRPRHLPLWRYNLFAMVHGHDRAAVADEVAQIAALLGDALRHHTVLFSRQVLKKSGLRLRESTPN